MGEVVCKDGVPGSALTWDWSAVPPWQKKQLGEGQFSPKSAWGTISMLIQERCGTWGRYFSAEASGNGFTLASTGEALAGEE